LRPRAVLIAAIASGQGKTSVTAALARRFKKLGQRVRLFKTGADFLDPRILAAAGGEPVYSLDLWMVGEAGCRALLERAARDADLILVEGAMGLYDGTPSAADLARAFDLSVIAVIDARAMAQTLGAVALGLRDYGPTPLAGVVANGVAGAGHRALLVPALREIPLLASLPRQAQSLPERHLGLVAPEEIADLDGRLEALADSLDFDTAVWERIPPYAPTTALAGTPGAAEAARHRAPSAVERPLDDQPRDHRPLDDRVIAVARDAAFGFLYPANLDCLQRLGARIAWFSPLADETVPAAARAVWLPGGYPELHAERLAGARRFQQSIRTAHAAGMPILAECGGMMVLAETLSTSDGQAWPMVGLLPGRVHLQARLAGLGLQSWSTEQGTLRGHTFHYSRFETPLAPVAQTCSHPRTGRGENVYRSGRLTASYFHAYFDSCPAATASLFGATAMVGRPAPADRNGSADLPS